MNDNHDDGSDARRRAERFVASLPEPSGGPDRDRTYTRLGMAIMLVGLAVAVVAVVMSQASNNPLDQSTQIAMGIAGIAAVCFGGVVFLRYSLGRVLRFWLLRILDVTSED